MTWFDDFGGVTPITDRLFRSPIPELPLHWRRIERAGVRTVFSLEEAVPGALAEAHGLAWRPHYWTDHAPPTPKQLEAFVTDLATAERPALVHCRAGWGRTGAAVCAALVHEGWSPEDALRHFWRLVPGSEREMRRTGQAESVRAYAARLNGVDWFGAAP